MCYHVSVKRETATDLSSLIFEHFAKKFQHQIYRNDFLFVINIQNIQYYLT